MSFKLFLIAASPTHHLSAHLGAVMGELARHHVNFSPEPCVLNPHQALYLTLDVSLDYTQMGILRDLLAPHQIDVLMTPTAMPLPRLLVADMDSTILQDETLDAIAAAIGIGERVADITARAMRGELDFLAALSARLELIAGTRASILDDVWAKQRFSQGAASLIATLRAHGTLCVLISGGFTFFTGRVAEALHFHHHHGNILTITNDVITARLTEPYIDQHSKRTLLEAYAQHLHVPLAHTAAIGDGANDLPMLKVAGLGIGYHPKPILRETLSNQILYGDLTAMLYACGLDHTQIHQVA